MSLVGKLKQCLHLHPQAFRHVLDGFKRRSVDAAFDEAQKVGAGIPGECSPDWTLVCVRVNIRPKYHFKQNRTSKTFIGSGLKKLDYTRRRVIVLQTC